MTGAGTPGGPRTPEGPARTAGMAARVPVADVIAFRMNAHHLTARLPDDGLIAAAGACAVQNSPPGSALLALHARVDGMRLETLDAAVSVRKSLLQTWSMRGSPFYFPTVDAAVFTTGVLPPTESAQRHLIQDVEPALRTLGMSLSEAVDHIQAVIRDALSGRRLAIKDLGATLAQRIAVRLPAWQRTIWQAPGPYAAGQPFGEAVVHFCLRILALRRVVCLVPAPPKHRAVRAGRRVARPPDNGR